MKNLLFTMIAVSGMVASAQNFQGMAVYETKTSTADFMAPMRSNRDISPEMQKMIEERMRKAFEKKFILNFDRQSSIYKEEESLEMGNDGGMRFMMNAIGGTGGITYKNIKDKSYLIEKEFQGKQFLIKDSLTKYEWKLEGESRQIGNYTCYKATAVVPVNVADFRDYRFKENKETKKDSTTTTKTAENSTTTTTTNIFDQWETPTEKTITAWYTPDIPVSNGPENYWGLPGLILEVHDGKTVILCSKLVINPKEKTTIKAPSSGKVIGQKEYDEIVKKKTEEMQQQWQRGNRGGGVRVQMR